MTTEIVDTTHVEELPPCTVCRHPAAVGVTVTYPDRVEELSFCSPACTVAYTRANADHTLPPVPLVCIVCGRAATFLGAVVYTHADGCSDAEEEPQPLCSQACATTRALQVKREKERRR